MTRKQWKNERIRQTYRLYNILSTYSICNIIINKKGELDMNVYEHLDDIVLDCIHKGADLKRRHPYKWGIMIWHAIYCGSKPSVIKILYDHAGLMDNITLLKGCEESDWDLDLDNSYTIYYDYTFETVLSQFYSLCHHSKSYIEKDEFYYESVQESEDRATLVRLRQKYFQEYSQIFDISKYDLNAYFKNKIYDTINE